MASTRAVPTAESGLTHYLEEIRRFPMLDRQEDYVLAKQSSGDRARSASPLPSNSGRRQVVDTCMP